ncbi:CIC11C00000000797 [Sungouiella intermedia]|uniref:CIC11C00000000797 n=1 Tax=Sungouiella intermedia TaxID=45354 RepID=A0A1L0DTA1_9ASCO|nr:CIC11C00000000797 [[Candida] intermedia]
MDLQIDEHFRLQEQVRGVDRENESRKLLIRLAVLKLLSLQNSAQRADKQNQQTQQTPPTSQGLLGNASEKLRDYELRISVLKLQLSTKEKVHEAQIDELKDLVALLQKQLDEVNSVRSERKVAPLGSKWTKPNFMSPPTSSGRSVSLGNKFLSPNLSVFSGASPVFTKQKILKGKGNSFADFGAESIASQASLKLSQSEKTEKPVYFSSPTSSVESTPIKKAPIEKNIEPAVSAEPEEAINEDDAAKLVIPEANANLTNISESEDLYQTANATLLEDGVSKKKKKIQLLSANASKIVLELQGRGLNVEEEDLNSLNYYHDDNFQDDHSSPIRPSKRKIEDREEPAKKRHVFKI